MRQLSLLLVLLWGSFQVWASNSDNWETFSDVGVAGLMGAALGLPAYKDDWQGVKQAGYSIAAAAGVSLAGKTLVSEERPDGSGDDSFPSGHSAVAFASATTLYRRYGWEKGLPAYAVATLVGIGRVEADKHYWKDVEAGAVIGIVSGWMLTDAFDDKVQLVPWTGRRAVGLAVSYTW